MPTPIWGHPGVVRVAVHRPAVTVTITPLGSVAVTRTLATPPELSEGPSAGLAVTAQPLGSLQATASSASVSVQPQLLGTIAVSLALLPH